MSSNAMQTNNPLKPPFIPLHLNLTAQELQLFDLKQYPIIHLQSCIEHMRVDESSLYGILHKVIVEEFPAELRAYAQAHQQAKWSEIEVLAHKMKGGAIYTGLVKLQYACQYFEDYYHSEQSLLLEGLYQQIIHTIQETEIKLIQLIGEQRC